MVYGVKNVLLYKQQKEEISENKDLEMLAKLKININIGQRQIQRYNLGNAISPNEAINILIITKGRSGSSFLGQLLSQYPGTFYSYEPLHYRNKFATPKEQMQLTKEVFQCNPSQGYVQHLKGWGRKPNIRYQDVCDTLPEDACFLREVYSTSCERFPIRLIKAIRFPYNETENLLLDPEMGGRLKIIFLFRDPRGRFNSLKNKMHWCGDNKCNVSQFCTDLKDQVFEAVNAKKKYKGKIFSKTSWYDRTVSIKIILFERT